MYDMTEQEIDLSAMLREVSLNADDMEDFVTAHLIIDCHCMLGEGIVFDERQHAVIWTDILKSRFHKLKLNYAEPSKVKFCTYSLPKKLGSFGMLEQQKEGAGLPLLCAWEDGFQLYDVEKGQILSDYSIGEDVNPDKGTTRLNDGRVDPNGRYFIGGGYYGATPGIKMKVFHVQQKDNGLYHEPIFDGVEITNSICWSPDGQTMYLADSPTKTINAYRYDAEKGTISDGKFLHQKLSHEKSVPDGCIVDAEGFLWNAVWRGGEGPGMVQRIDPTTGKVVFTVHMPDHTSQVSCCCFGGEDLDILFITTAAEGRDHEKEAHAGGLYAVKLPFKGREESRLQFSL